MTAVKCPHCGKCFIPTDDKCPFCERKWEGDMFGLPEGFDELFGGFKRG
jgi:uncharacterized OB-fold protein